MSVIDQFLYRAPRGPRGTIQTAASSSRAESDRWLQLLDPWLRAGLPPGRAYLNFGTRAVAIRWNAATDAVPGWEFAHVLVGPGEALTDAYTLKLPELARDRTALRNGRLGQITDITSLMDPGPDAIAARARSSTAIPLLVPVLTSVLAGDQVMAAPWTGTLVPEAVLWALVSILSILGDNRPLSFLTCAPGKVPTPPGLFVFFQPKEVPKPRHPEFGRAAFAMAASYADNGPRGLRTQLEQHGILSPPDLPTRVARLLDLWPGSPQLTRSPAGATPGSPAESKNPSGGSQNAAPPNQKPKEQSVGQALATPSPDGGVICPICLSELDWGTLPLWRQGSGQGMYVPVEIPQDASTPLRARMERGALVRCPDPYHIVEGEHHYLPADYGRYGRPVVIGLIGLTRSGKSHLLAAMVGEIERGALRDDYGIGSRAIDQAVHKAFLLGRVNPLLKEDKVLSGTEEGVVNFADGFLISPPQPPGSTSQPLKRPVALFDVAGGELSKVDDDAKRFLDVADGLIFVVDPIQLDANELGDDTFNTVLELLKASNRLPDQVSAAIVLNKADLLRFDDPVALWMRYNGRELDPDAILRESADVYAYLEKRQAQAWLRPFSECSKATLHVASSTGGSGPPEGAGGVYSRGVTPRRVLQPLVALLAMTGVLTDAQAMKVGI